MSEEITQREWDRAVGWGPVPKEEGSKTARPRKLNDWETWEDEEPLREYSYNNEFAVYQ